MRLKLTLLLYFALTHLIAQNLLYRTMPQPNNTNYAWGEMEHTKEAPGRGYLIGYNWITAIGIESGYLSTGKYVIKTDTNFIPIWRKEYSGSISLSTGGIILFHRNYIEKVTNSGSQVWIKYLNADINLSDAVAYHDKVRFIGNYNQLLGSAPNQTFTTSGLTILMDSSGNFINQTQFVCNQTYTNSSGTFTYAVEFSKIKQDGSGNFYVFTTNNLKYNISSTPCVIKFDSNFNILWSKTIASQSGTPYFSDIDIFGNGRIFALIRLYGAGTPKKMALLKLDNQGNFILSKMISQSGFAGGLKQKSTGVYIGTASGNGYDSLFMFECDTSLSLNWLNFNGIGHRSSNPVIRNNLLYTAAVNFQNLHLFANNLNGNSCRSYSLAQSTTNFSLSINNFSFTPVSYSMTVSNSTVNLIQNQGYIDSCKCPVSINSMSLTTCINATGSITVSGHSNISWYGSSTGSDFIKSGNSYTFSSSTAITHTVYVQDSVCIAPPYRTAITFSVLAPPSLTLSSQNASICLGSNTVVTVSGANSYSWSNGLPAISFQNLNPSTTTIYTVTGFNGTACSSSKTLQINVFPYPSLSYSPHTHLCVGQSYTVSASGATTYSWSNGSSLSSFSILPTAPINQTIQLIGKNWNCSTSTVLTLSIQSIPSITIMPSSNTLCTGQSTLFAYGANSYSWSNGVTGSVHINYNSYTGSISVNGNINGCTSNTVIPITIHPTPTLQISASTTSPCKGSTLQLIANGAATYSWNTGHQTPSLNLVASSGSNVYTLSGSSGFCNSNLTYSFVSIPLPTVNITANPSFFCTGKTNTLYATGANTYTWSTGIVSASLAATPTVVGSSIYTVIGSNGQCLNTATYQSQNAATPTIQIAFSDSIVCINSALTLSASGVQNYSLFGLPIQVPYTFTPSFSGIYSVSGSNQQCVNTASSLIQVITHPTINIVPSSTFVCEGSVITLSASGAYQYTWSNNSQQVTTSIVATPTLNYISVTGAIGNCSITTGINITTILKPSLSILAPNYFCLGAVTTITANGASTYSWSNGTQQHTVALSPTSNMTMSLFGANFQCTSSATYTFYVAPSPTISIAGPTFMCRGEIATFTASGGHYYKWQNGSNNPTVTIRPIGNGHYSVLGIDTSGCEVNATIHYTVSECESIDESQWNSTINISPNPTRNLVKIENHTNDATYEFELFGIDGKLLLLLTVNQTYELDLSTFASGVYILRNLSTKKSYRLIKID